MTADFEPIEQRIEQNLQFLNFSIALIRETSQKLYETEIPAELQEIEDENSIAMSNIYQYMLALKQETEAHEVQMNTHLVLLERHNQDLKSLKAEIEETRREMLQNEHSDVPIAQLMEMRDKEEKAIEQETERLAHLEHQVKESCQRFFLLFDEKMIRHPYQFMMPKKKGREIPLEMPEFQSTYIPAKWQEMWERETDLNAKSQWNEYYCQMNYMNDEFYAEEQEDAPENPAQDTPEYDYNEVEGYNYNYDNEGGQRDYYNE